MAMSGTCWVSLCNTKINERYNVKFVVVKGDYTPFIGSHAFQQINLVTVYKENILQVMPYSPADLTLAQIDEEFKDGFKGQGCKEGKLHPEVCHTSDQPTLPSSVCS